MRGLLHVGEAAAERQHHHLGRELAAVIADDVEEMKHQPGAIVGGDEGAAALLPDQDVFIDQFIDRLADRADGHLAALGQLPLGGNGTAGLPLAGADGLGQQSFDFLVQRRIERGASDQLLVARRVFPFAHTGFFL